MTWGSDVIRQMQHQAEVNVAADEETQEDAEDLVAAFGQAWEDCPSEPDDTCAYQPAAVQHPSTSCYASNESETRASDPSSPSIELTTTTITAATTATATNAINLVRRESRAKASELLRNPYTYSDGSQQIEKPFGRDGGHSLPDSRSERRIRPSQSQIRKKTRSTPSASKSSSNRSATDATALHVNEGIEGSSDANLRTGNVAESCEIASGQAYRKLGQKALPASEGTKEDRDRKSDDSSGSDQIGDDAGTKAAGLVFDPFRQSKQMQRDLAQKTCIEKDASGQAVFMGVDYFELRLRGPSSPEAREARVNEVRSQTFECHTSGDTLEMFLLGNNEDVLQALTSMVEASREFFEYFLDLSGWDVSGAVRRILRYWQHGDGS